MNRKPEDGSSWLLLTHQGVLRPSTSPNYPSGTQGDMYITLSTILSRKKTSPASSAMANLAWSLIGEKALRIPFSCSKLLLQETSDNILCKCHQSHLHVSPRAGSFSAVVGLSCALKNAEQCPWLQLTRCQRHPNFCHRVTDLPSLLCLIHVCFKKDPMWPGAVAHA